jgi:hypothetical protein
VLFQSDKDFFVDFVTNGDNYCFAAKYCNEKMTVQKANKSEGNASLCSTTPCNTLEPKVIIRNYNGNIYANIIPGIGEPTIYPSILNGSYTELDFDVLSQAQFAELLKLYNATTKADSLFFIEVGNVECMSSSSNRFLATPNPSYLEAKPWLISFFSLTLLIRNIYEFQTRLVPGFCPYKPFPTTTDLYTIKALLASKIYTSGTIDNTDEVALLYSNDLPPYSDTYEDSTGVMKQVKTLAIFEITKYMLNIEMAVALLRWKKCQCPLQCHCMWQW